MLKRLWLIVLLTALLAACGGEQAPEPTATVTPLPSATPAPTNTNTPVPSPTPAPTNTPTPTPTPEPSATPDALAGGQEYEIATIGVTLTYPEGWVAEDFLGILTIIADSPETAATGLETDQLTEGAVMLVFGGPDDGEEMLTMDDLFDDPNVTVIEGPEPVTINGAQGMRVLARDTSNDDDLTVLALFLQINDWTYVFVGVTPTFQADEFVPLLEATMRSAEFGEPTGYDGFLGGAMPTDISDLAVGDVVEDTVTEDGRGFAVNLAADQQYLIAAGGSGDLVLTVYDATGASVASVDDSLSGELELLVWQPPAAGVYTIGVRNFSVGATGDLLLTVQEADPVVGTSVTFTADGATVPVVYAVSEDGDDLVLEVSADSGDDDPIAVDDSISQPEVLVLADLAPGSYTADARGFADLVDDYTLIVVLLDARFAAYGGERGFGGDVGREPAAIAGPLGLNAVTTYAFPATSAVFEATVSADTTYVIAVTGSDQTDMVISVTDADGFELARADRTGLDQVEVLAWTAEEAGTWTVTVEDFYGDPSTYAIAFYAVTDPLASETVNVTVGGARHTVVVVIPVDDSDLTLTVLDDDGNTVDTVDTGFDGEPEVFGFFDLTPGDYVVEYGFFSGSGVPVFAVVEVDSAEFTAP